MRTAVAIFLIGIGLLFLGSMVCGRKVFSPAERELAPAISSEQKQIAGANDLGEKKADYKKIRFAFSSFDLVAGITLRELETTPLNPGYRFVSFLFLIACLWLVFALRRFGRPS